MTPGPLLGAALAAAASSASPPAQPQQRQLSCTLADSGLSYACHRSGEMVMSGAPIACFVNGEWHTAGKTLSLVNAGPVYGSDAIGKFTGKRLRWKAGRQQGSIVTFVTTVRNYDSAVVFEYGFPDGANGTEHHPTPDPVFPWRAAHSTIANFPAMASVAPRRALSWQDAFITPQLELATGPNAGVSIFMDDASGSADVLVASPLNHFIGSSTGNTLADGQPAAWSLGLASTIKSLPPGFTHSLILYAGVGVTQAIHDWGSLQLRLANSSKIADPTLTKLSYQTGTLSVYLGPWWSYLSDR